MACSETTSSNILRNLEFCVNDSGVGGSFVVLPMARSGFVGSEGSKDKI